MNLDHSPPFPTLSTEVFDSLPESIRSYIRYLETTLQQQQVRIQQLEARVHELEARLSKDSSNSSKPPGSDGLKKKTKSQRGKSGKKQGARQGHVGKGLAQIGNPNLIVTHAPINCHGCGSNLGEVNGTCAEKRQVFDIPQPKIEVTEHQALEKQCPCCGEFNRGAFPENIRGPVQYGLCNAHHLRELTFIHEQENEGWAKRMKDLLIFAKNEVERHLEKGTLPQEILLQVEEGYGQIIAEGFEYHSLLPPLPKGKRGRQKQRVGKNLLDRLKEKRSCVLLFMYDFSVGFTKPLCHFQQLHLN